MVEDQAGIRFKMIDTRKRNLEIIPVVISTVEKTEEQNTSSNNAETEPGTKVMIQRRKEETGNL